MISYKYIYIFWIKMLGLKYNLTVEGINWYYIERFNYDRRMQSSLALLYIVNVFTYSLAIVLISY